MRLPKDRRQRVAIIVIAISVIAVIISLIQILADGSDDEALDFPDDSFVLNPGFSATPDPSLGDSADGIDQFSRGGLLGSANPFTTVTSPAKRRTVTIRVTTSSLVLYGYRWRDKDGPAPAGTSTTVNVTRTFVTKLPAAQVALQVGPDGGKASCSVIVDGKTLSSSTADGPFDFAVCYA